jgi:hypothetical protein
VRLDPKTARLLVLAVALTVFALKAWVALDTYGTNDIDTFKDFAQGVRDHGPVGVYSIDFRALPHHWLYNHPPLVGYFLQFINLLSDHGIRLRVTLRVVSSAADVITALVVFAILRRRVSLLRATLSGSAVAASPLLFFIAGYHGNTDPIFVMLVLLGSFLIIDESRGVWGGIALGLALGIKIVALVALPAVAVYLLVHRRKDLLAATAAFAVTVGATWGPAVVREWAPLHHNVLAYSGINHDHWGIVRLAIQAGSPSVTQFLTGPGVHLIPLLCALLPALVAWRVPDKAMEAVALSLVATLVFLPAYGIQYLSWAAAAAYLLDEFSATLYNLLGGFIVFQVYDYWNFGSWSEVARAWTVKPQTIWLLGLLWAALIAVLVGGVRRVLSNSGSGPPASNAGDRSARRARGRPELAAHLGTSASERAGLVERAV